MPEHRIQLSSLTGLRFFAAIGVVFYHLRIYFDPIGDSLAIFSYGFTGVSFFFILSGFVLTWSQPSDVRTGRFYWNRFARIWPLHILTMIASIWVPPLIFPSSTGWSAAPLVLKLTQAWIPLSTSLNAFNGVSWTLSCEAFFYLLFPILFKDLNSLRVPRFGVGVFVALVMAGIVLSTVTSTDAANYLLGTSPLYRLGEFVLGMCLSTLMKQGWRPSFGLAQAIGLAVALTAGLLVASLSTNGTAAVAVIYANLIMLPGFLAVIAAAADRDLSGRRTLLGSKIFVRLGQWSFALYLVHELVIRIVRPVLTDLTVVGNYAVATLAVTASVALSGVLHEFVEKPAEKWLCSRRAPLPGDTGTVEDVHHRRDR